jgi:PAS domain S-box-containing protein
MAARRMPPDPSGEAPRRPPGWGSRQEPSPVTPPGPAGGECGLPQQGSAALDPESLRSQIATLEELLDVQQRAVSERTQRLEQTLRELQYESRRVHHSEQRLRSILEAALDAVVCFDSHGVVIEWNPRAELVLGWSREQALGRTAEELRIPLARRQGAASGQPGSSSWDQGLVLDQRVEATATHHDGWEFPVELGVSRIGQADDAVFSAFLRDITDRKEGQEDLAEARDGALAASRLKSEFLATVSHEVRTPMNGVVGMTELLLSTTLTAEQRDYAQAIQRSAEVLLAILNDILDFSKIEAGRLVLESLPFDLRQVVEETVDLLAPNATRKGLELVVYYAPEAPTGLLGDPLRLRQILMNLTGNAIKFTDSGQVAVRIECGQSTPAGARMNIVVEDSGIGIPRDKLDHIFEKFVQADPTTTRKYGGTGLGLAITRRLVEMMGGALEVQSTLGKGSRFLVRLELPQAPQAAADKPEVSLSGLRVLVVDDNEINRRVVHDQLAPHGVVASLAAGGEEALAALRSAQRQGVPFDIALLDYQMPGMDGEALALEIKADATLWDTVLVLLTSGTGQSHTGHALLVGFADVIVKPVRPSQLLRSLARVRGQGASAPPRSRPAAAGLSGGVNAGGKPHRARVLVAEDSPVNQKVVARMLEKLDCAVDLAADGKQAVRMAEAAHYDLIFMDCQMPEMDGYEATAMIRQQPNRRHTPIIALTANAMQGDRERCLRAGMDDYLAKPIKVSDLTDTLKRWAAAPVGKAG